MQMNKEMNILISMADGEKVSVARVANVVAVVVCHAQARGWRLRRGAQTKGERTGHALQHFATASNSVELGRPSSERRQWTRIVF